MNAAVMSKADALRQLMQDDAHREVECQAYLEDAYSLLMPPFSRMVQIVREQVAMAGRSDYFVLCEVHEVDVRRRLVLWEAKAPQLAPFEVATQNRLTPSRALVEAESQLLYYFDEYRGNAQFRDRYNLRHEDDIQLGGIIIGREDNWVSQGRGDNLPPDVLRQMAASAYRIRNAHFYRDRIRLLTWDRIAQAIEPAPAPLQA